MELLSIYVFKIIRLQSRVLRLKTAHHTQIDPHSLNGGGHVR